MVSKSQANYIINIGLHIFILFTFLTIFFFLYISKLSKKLINKTFKKGIDQQLDGVLTNLDEWDEKLSYRSPNSVSVNWQSIDQMAKKITANSQGELTEITENNNRLKMIGGGIIIGLLVLIVGLYYYFTRVKYIKIDIGRILMENVIIFSFIGMIEVYFFTKIISKFIPVTPDFAIVTILERVKFNIAKFVL